MVAKAKRNSCSNFIHCNSISEVLDLGKPSNAPKVKTRPATLNDLSKVERLRALRDCPTATEGERANATAKLNEIEKEIEINYPPTMPKETVLSGTLLASILG